MSQEAVVMLLRLMFAAAALIALAAFVVRPLLRLLRQKPDVELLTPNYGEMLEGEELEIPSDEEAGMPDRQTILDKMREDPREAALVVQQWLKERK